MLRNITFHRVAMTCVLLSMDQAALGQTLTISNDIQTYSTIPTTTTLVTVTGRSELRLTGATNPIAAPTIINLVPTDAWLFLTSIRPAVVNSTYLSRIQINGAAAVLNTNCRVVEHADGTVVIPHASSLAPLQVFAGSHFTGSSLSLQNYTAFNDAGLGALANNISSFKLKRGYTATIAQNSSGTGVSKNYVAQDGDIEVSVLPATLNDSVSFVRVFPWRWVTKKGSCDVDPTALNATWHYNWNIDKNSPLNWEYVAIKQQPYWPSLTQNWQTRGVNHLLGLNEPNNPVEDSYQNLTPVGSVSNAVARMPDLLGTGLRVGAPAVTDGGYSWITDFVNQAAAAGHRLDFVPIHYYRSYANNDNPAGAASSMYNFLKSIHDATGRPIWVTEFNNGANWTDNAHDPSATQNRNVIQAMINMMDDTPWIERYAVYSNVEWFRMTHYGDGSLTPMGTMYRDHSAPIAYQQVIPEVPTSPAALYRFENNARDSSAYGHAAITKGGAKFTTGHTGQAVALSGVAANDDHVQLSTRLGDSTDFTFGAWVYWGGGANWQRIFDLGSSTTSYMFLSPAAGSGNLRFAIADGGAEQQLNHNAPLPVNTWTHVAVTIGGNTGKLFVNGALVATNAGMTLNPVNLGTSINFLGKSQYAADPLFAGKLDEVEFLPYALTDAKVLALTTNNPPQFTSATISGGSATQNVAFNGTIAGSATDADAGDTITYSKVSGPAWLVVAASGLLSGTPSFDDTGNQEFIVYATDSVGVSAVAALTIQMPIVTGNGTWSVDTNGNWSETAKWTGNFPANGISNTANFSTLNLSADRTVTLDASRSIGTLLFGDTAGAENWTLAAANGRDLTLDVTSGSPSIAVNQNTATITASLDGIEGFTKSGPGSLILKGDNPLSGILYVDISSTTLDGGLVRLANPNAATSLTGIQIRNNNAGSSTLELDGTLGDVTATAPISLNGRGGTVPAFRNLSGDNALAGAFTLQSGGNNYCLQSDAGSLTLGGALTSNAPNTARSLIFQGAGNIILDGVVSNGTTTGGIAIVKNGAGTLTLNGANTHTGPMAINGGTVTLGGSGARTEAAVSMVAGTTLNINRTITLAGAVSGSGTINNAGSTAVTGDFTAFAGSYTHNSAFVSTAFNAALSTSKNASYHLASVQGAAQGFIAAGNGNYTLEMGALNGVAGSLFRGGNSATGTTILQVGNLNGNDTFAGAIANGATKVIAFTKAGSGTMSLSGPNTYTGATTVNGGTLLVNGSTAASAVTVATGGTLGGIGTVGGGVTVQAGGNLAPGAGGIGKLTTTGTVVLQAGSTTRMEINKTAATRDVLAAGTTLTYGGTLLVTNLGGTLTAGDTFTLFQAGTINGAFSAVTLPPLNFGFMWNTSALPSGTISVLPIVSTYPGWASGHAFPLGTEASTYDADGDGMVNAIEWLFGSNPLASDTGFLPQPTVRELSTAEYPAAVAGKTYLTMTARVRKIHTGMTLVPQANSSLESLDAPASSGFVTSFLVNDLGDFEQRTWIYTVPIEDSPDGQGFMRLKLSGD